MDQFWTFRDFLPKGIGYTHFSPQHLFCITVFLICFYLTLRVFDHSKHKRGMIRIAAICALCLETFRDILLACIGRFTAESLPFHLCGQAIFVNLIRECIHSEKWKSILGEISFILLMPGACCAVLFPDWCEYYPVFNYWNINGYASHFFFILYPFLIYRNHEIHPDIHHWYYEVLYLICTCIPVYLFNVHFHTNFVFLNEPVEPLTLLADVFGNPGYLIPYAGLGLLLILMMYALEKKLRRGE